MSQDTSSYLTEKCEVRDSKALSGCAVFARSVIVPRELVGVWSGQVVGKDALNGLPGNIRSNTVQIEENLYLASLSPDESPDFINHSCDPNAGLSG